MISRWLFPFKGRGMTLLSLLFRGDFRRAKNYFWANWAMIRRPNTVNHYPTTIVVDPGNVCNLSCVFCITGQRKSKRPPRFLPLADFKKIIDQLGSFAFQLDLYNWGEPFLNKDIFAMIAYAKKTGLRVELSSNLHCFSPAMARKIINSGLDRLIVSLHGATPKMTQIYMRGGNFPLALNNLRALIQMKKTLKSPNPSITWRYVVNRYNEIGVEKARTLAQKLKVDCFELLPLHLDIGSDPKQIKEAIRKNAHWLPKNPRYLPSHSTDCFWPWEIVVVNPDGTVQPCCIFSNPAFDFSNILETSFWQIWNGAKYQTARRVIASKIKIDKTTVCGHCVASSFIGK